MCYAKPGPRCSAHAAAKLAKVKMARTFSEESEQEIAEAQAEYDSTPAGFLELERRITDEKEKPIAYQSADIIQEYEERLAHGKASRAAALAAIKAADKGDVNNHKEQRLEPLHLLQQEPYELMSIDRRDSPESQESKTFLIDASQEWTQRMTPEEIEAVSWGTSNGTSVMRAHLAGEEHEIWGEDIYPKEHLDQVKNNLDRAMDKAPRLEKPINIYRGIQGDLFETFQATPEEVKNMFPVGSTYTPPFPESATAMPKIAYGFSSTSVIMQIKTKTLATPVNISAWGSSEQETLLSHRKTYDITAINEEQWGESKSGYERNVIVVYLEEQDENK